MASYGGFLVAPWFPNGFLWWCSWLTEFQRKKTVNSMSCITSVLVSLNSTGLRLLFLISYCPQLEPCQQQDSDHVHPSATLLHLQAV